MRTQRDTQDIVRREQDICEALRALLINYKTTRDTQQMHSDKKLVYLSLYQNKI